MYTHDIYIIYQHINRDIILSFLSMGKLIHVIIKQSTDPNMGKRNSLGKVWGKHRFSLCDY